MPRERNPEQENRCIAALETQAGDRMLLLEGDLPSSMHPPRGCVFHTRCSFAKEVCRTDEPALSTVGDRGRLAPCHFVETRADGTIVTPRDALS